MSTGYPHSLDPLPPRKNGSNWVTIVAVILGALLVLSLLCAGVLAALLWPAIDAARDAARRAESGNQMKMIGLALHNYHDQYRSFPPAYTTDEAGRPLLSWRVLILPQMEQAHLYEQFHLDEPWDSPHNATLLDSMPAFYRSPRAEAGSTSTETNYLAIRSPNSIFPGADPVKFSQVSDGLSNTAAVIELQASGIPWTRPDDVTPQQAYAAVTEGTNLLISDGSMRHVDANLDQTTFEALVTRDGNERVAF